MCKSSNNYIIKNKTIIFNPKYNKLFDADILQQSQF